ncbi:PPOX class F420-dependent oxidoreductase [Nocardia sp. alder85J]|uniref:PPOX class F420-dependent oxidoreductase n=1 Tax=Nocardia sp. alder85J TaxID=2862949 RepID=UPI001CD20819|nr:PPOX class F420-dependent oxidoreductase [Nocardia sp. alder85J]MCX4092829.1 PPOX class F420-dependent oxidoreductase [Nocardia sp. alder85J]
MDNPFGTAGTAKYVLLTTFRKDGTPVGTPIWAALDDGKLYVWTVADSWKVKRIRRNPAVTVQACNASGKPQGDEVVEATAHILDEAGGDRTRTLIKKRYSLPGWLVVTASTLRRGRNGTVGIEITAGRPE